MLRPTLDVMKNKITPGSIPPESIIFEEKNLKMIVYSGHDDDITQLIAFFNLTNNDLVPYASTFLFELHWKEISECADS